MQPEPFAPHIITAFLKASCRHFGLIPKPSIAPGQPETSRLRPMLRSLAFIGSLGTALAQPALAAETSKADMTPRPSFTQEKSKP